MTGRAIRRAALARMKAKAKRLQPDNPRAAMHAEHLAVCSCWMCGNPRRFTGERTIQERRAGLDTLPMEALKGILADLID